MLLAIARSGVLAADEPPLPSCVAATLKGHKEMLYAVAFSPDGKYLVTGSFDQTIKLWDAVTGKEIKTLAGSAGHQKQVLAVAFSPDGQSLASGAQDNTAKIWDLSTSKTKKPSDAPVKNFPHPNLVDAVAFNPTGTLLATACHDGIVRIFDVAKGTQVRQISAHTAPTANAVYCLAWSPDGKQLVSGSFDRSMKLWNAETGTLVKEFKPHKDKEFEKGHRDGVFCVAFSPDGMSLASGSSDRTIKIWRVADGTVVMDLVNPQIKAGPLPGSAQSHPGWIYGLRFTKEGKYLVSAGNAPRNQGYLAVWNVADGKMLHGESLPLGPFYSVAVSPDGKFVAVACGPRGRDQQEVDSFVLKMPGI